MEASFSAEDELTSRYKVLKNLGEGTFGKVNLGKNLITGE